jgi:hypothetical protein
MLKKTITTAFISIAIFLSVTPLLVLAHDDGAIESVTGNKYYSADEVLIDEPVEGDVLVTAKRLTITAPIKGNLIALTGEMLIDAEITGDLFMASGYVVINKNINGDIRAAVGDLYINSNISGDLNIFADKIAFGVNSVTGGFDYVNAGQRITSAENPTDLSRAGESAYSFSRTQKLKSMLPQIAGLGVVFQLIMKIFGVVGMVIAGYVLIRSFPSFTEKTLVVMRKNALFSIALGSAVILSAPFVAIVLLVSGFGIYLFYLLALFMLLAFFFSSVYFNYFAGRFILKKFNLKKGRFFTLLIGTLVSELILFGITLLPIVGMLLWFTIMFFVHSWGVGSILGNKIKTL